MGTKSIETRRNQIRKILRTATGSRFEITSTKAGVKMFRTFMAVLRMTVPMAEAAARRAVAPALELTQPRTTTPALSMMVKPREAMEKVMPTLTQLPIS